MSPAYVGGALALVTFPLVASKLGVQQYGQLDLFILLGTILNFGFHLGWASAHNRFYLEPDIERANLIRTLFVARVWIVGVIILLTFVLQNRLLEWLGAGPQHAFMIWIVVGTFICTEFSQFHLQRYRMLNQARNYAVMALAKALLYPLFLLPALFLLHPTPALVLICTFVSVAVSFGAALMFDHKWLLKGNFDWSVFKRSLRYGVPLVPAVLAVMGLQITDRAMLRSLVADPEWSLILLGYYAFALRLVSIKNLATSGFNILWIPYVWRSYQREDSPINYSYIFSTYLLLLFILTLTIIILAQILVPIFMADYSPALPILSVLLASAIAYSIGDYFCIGIGIHEKTWIRAGSGGITLVVNIALNFMLIPVYGAMGAALATFVGTLCYVGILMLASHRLYQVPYRFITFLFVVFFVLATSVMQDFEIIVMIMVAVLFLLFFSFLLGKDAIKIYREFYSL